METQDDVTVALATEITLLLKQEGIAREFVNRVQNARKEQNFNVVDRIVITAVSASPELTEAIKAFEPYICNETLSTGILITDKLDNGIPIEIDDLKTTIAIARHQS